MIGMSGLDESMTIPATRTRPESSVQVHLTYPAEEELLALIQSAEHSISFAGPGMSTRLATAIVRKDGCVITLTVDRDSRTFRRLTAWLPQRAAWFARVYVDCRPVDNRFSAGSPACGGAHVVRSSSNRGTCGC